MVCGANALPVMRSASARHCEISAVSTVSSSVKSTRRYEPVDTDLRSGSDTGSVATWTVTCQSSFKLSAMDDASLHAMQPERWSARTCVRAAHRPRRLRLYRL